MVIIKCIIWGASLSGKLAYMLYSKQLTIKNFTDNDAKKWGEKICGVKIISPERVYTLIRENNELVIIIASMYVEEISTQLIKMGISRDKIIIFSQTHSLLPINQKEDSQRADIFISDYGVKAENQLINSYQLPDAPHDMVDVKSLKLGLDWLKDPFTLAGKSIVDSPHLEFIQALSTKDEDITRTNYIRRKIQGTLDFRQANLITETFLKESMRLFEFKVNELLGNTYSPIKVVSFKGKRYILDGKHRAAMAYLMNIEKIKAVDLTYTWNDSYYHWIFKLIENKKVFSKNRELYSEYLLHINSRGENSI